MKVIGLGNALMDVLLKLDNDNALQQLGIEKGAMEMISEEQMLAIRESQNTLERHEVPGGSVCNTMRAITLLGNAAGFIGKVGSDKIASSYKDALIQYGVIPYFIKTEGVSGSCTVLISPDGERTMCTFLGPAPNILPEEISENMLRGYHYIYIEGYLLVNEPLVRSIMIRAKQMGLKVALDLSNFNIVNSFKKTLKEIIPQYVDILFSNESEAKAYTGLPAKAAVQSIAKEVEISLVTIGKEGAYVGSKDLLLHIPAYGGKPVDTTGAGDHFAAGFLYGQTQGATLKQSAQIGSLLSGYIINTVGAQIPPKDWEQIKLKVKEILA